MERRDLEAALKAARTASQVRASESDRGALHSIDDGSLRGRLEETWDYIADASRKCFEVGKDAAQSAVDQAKEAVTKLLNSAGTRVTQVADDLSARLDVAVQGMIDRALGRLRPTISVGTSSLVLHEISVSQTITFGGSLGGKIDELFTLSSNGQLEVHSIYRGK
jgi:hypothetical protein